MAGAVPIRLRRMLTEQPIDPAPLASPMWHELDEKFGVWNGTEMCWYPAIRPTLKTVVLNDDQALGGRDNTGADNPIVIDFSNPGQLNIVDRSNSDHILATFTQNGVAFTNPISDGVAPGGSLQRTSHPGFLPSLFSSTAISSDSGPAFFGPNTYLWKKASGAAGSASVRYAYGVKGAGALTHSSAESYTLEFAVNGNVPNQNIGMRSWFFDPSLAYDGISNKNKVYFSYYGPSGQGTTFRVGRGGNYTELTVIGSGRWQRVGMVIPTHDISTSFAYNAANTPFSFDYFVNTTGGTWYMNEITVQSVDVVVNELYQFRTLAERMAVADAYYWRPPTQYMLPGLLKSMELPMQLPAYTPNALYDVIDLGSDFPLAITEKGQRAFTIGTSGAPTAQWKAKFKVGYRGPLTDIA